MRRIARLHARNSDRTRPGSIVPALGRYAPRTGPLVKTFFPPPWSGVTRFFLLFREKGGTLQGPRAKFQRKASGRCSGTAAAVRRSLRASATYWPPLPPMMAPRSRPAALRLAGDLSSRFSFSPRLCSLPARHLCSSRSFPLVASRGAVRRSPSDVPIAERDPFFFGLARLRRRRYLLSSRLRRISARCYR